MIDLHTHLLPGLDDGPSSLEESIALARAMVAAGTTVAAATPHVSTRYPTERGDIAAAAQLREALASASLELEIREGVEVELIRTRDLSDDELLKLRLGGCRWLLLEPPLSATAGNPLAEIEGLLERGHHLMLAHAERCPGLRRSPGGLRRLVAAGVLVSLNAASLSGFGRPAQRFAGDLVRARLAHCIASDAHDLDARPPAIGLHLAAAARKSRSLRRQAGWLTEPAPAAILADSDLPPRPRAFMQGMARRALLPRPRKGGDRR